MRSGIVNETLVISINHDEACRLIDGAAIVDRGNPLDIEAKTEVRPLTELDPFYEPVRKLGEVATFGENLRKYKCIAQMLGNMDVLVFVPLEVPSYALIASERIKRDDVQIMVPEDQVQGFRQVIPQGGIQVRFDGRMPEPDLEQSSEDLPLGNLY